MENESRSDPGPTFEGEDSFLRNIYRLFFRPWSFYAGIAAPKKRIWLNLFAFTCSTAYALDRSGFSSMQGTPPAISWTMYWMSIGVWAFIGSFLILWIGGMWYQFRLKLCGAVQPDIKLVRMVYFSAAQIYALPMIGVALAETFLYEDPAAAAAGEPVWLIMLPILFLTWSYIGSYAGVRTVFKVPKLRAAIYFLILPVLFLFVAVGSGYLIARAELSSSAPKADVSRPQEFSEQGIAFSYPGNWRITESGPSPGVKAKIEIQGQGGAYFLLQRIETADSAELFADKWANNMKESLSLTSDLKPFGAWGTFKGAGRRFEAWSMDVLCEYRLFVASTAGGEFLMICETFPKADKTWIAPGFKQIRKTFRMTS